MLQISIFGFHPLVFGFGVEPGQTWNFLLFNLLKLTACTWKWMVGIRSFPLGTHPDTIHGSYGQEKITWSLRLLILKHTRNVNLSHFNQLQAPTASIRWLVVRCIETRTFSLARLGAWELVLKKGGWENQGWSPNGWCWKAEIKDPY